MGVATSSPPSGSSLLFKKILVCVLMFLSNVICFADRTNISVCIIMMAKEYGWSNSTQGFVLSSFYIGYIFTQVVGGLLSEWLHGKVVLFAGIALWSCATMLTPVAADLSFKYNTIFFLIASRIAMGISEGVNFPALFNICGKWYNSNEKSRYMTFIMSGIEVGSILATTVAPVITHHLGWRFVFYIFGAAGVIFPFILVFLLPTNDPTMLAVVKKPKSDTPIYYDTLSTPDSTIEGQEENVQTSKKMEDEGETSKWKVYLKLIVSMPVWAIVVAQTCVTYGMYMIQNWLPKYFYSLNVPFEKVGFASMIPLLSIMIFSNVVGFISDFMISKLKLPVDLVRKMNQSMAFLGAGLFLVLLRFLHGDLVLCLIFFCIIMACMSFSRGASTINHLDIAPKYAGMLVAISNTFATIPGIVGNLLTGWMLDKTNGDWNFVFGTVSVVNMFGCVFYFLFAKGHVIFK